jgi:hypothetical protein
VESVAPAHGRRNHRLRSLPALHGPGQQLKRQQSGHQEGTHKPRLWFTTSVVVFLLQLRRKQTRCLPVTPSIFSLSMRHSSFDLTILLTYLCKSFTRTWVQRGSMINTLLAWLGMGLSGNSEITARDIQQWKWSVGLRFIFSSVLYVGIRIHVFGLLRGCQISFFWQAEIWTRSRFVGSRVLFQSSRVEKR